MLVGLKLIKKSQLSVFGDAIIEFDNITLVFELDVEKMIILDDVDLW